MTLNHEMKDKKTIEANAINLTDADGKIRITLDAALPDGVACITLFSRSGSHSIHLSAQPDDRVEISVRGKAGLANVTMLVTPKSDHCSIIVTDPNGKPAVTVGRLPYEENPHQSDVVVYEDGQAVKRLKDK